MVGYKNSLLVDYQNCQNTKFKIFVVTWQMEHSQLNKQRFQLPNDLTHFQKFLF